MRRFVHTLGINPQLVNIQVNFKNPYYNLLTKWAQTQATFCNRTATTAYMCELYALTELLRNNTYDTIASFIPGGSNNASAPNITDIRNTTLYKTFNWTTGRESWKEMLPDMSFSATVTAWSDVYNVWNDSGIGLFHGQRLPMWERQASTL